MYGPHHDLGLRCLVLCFCLYADWCGIKDDLEEPDVAAAFHTPAQQRKHRTDHIEYLLMRPLWHVRHCRRATLQHKPGPFTVRSLKRLVIQVVEQNKNHSCKRNSACETLNQSRTHPTSRCPFTRVVPVPSKIHHASPACKASRACQRGRQTSSSTNERTGFSKKVGRCRRAQKFARCSQAGRH
jgi:hypothetical protein